MQPRKIWPSKQKSAMKDYKYRRKLYLVTRSELQFFKTLLSGVNQFYYVIPQVHLSTLLNHKTWGQNWKGALSRIDRKSVDYVICSRENLVPICAIELDDKSHDRADRIKRDRWVEQILKDAGLPLVRIRMHEQENVNFLVEKLNSVSIPDRIRLFLRPN